MNIVNPQGQPIKLTTRQKNEIYAKAKWLRENLRDRLCTNRECEQPTDRNVRKMLKGEFKAHNDMDIYRKMMQLQGADPNECDANRLRRR